MAGSADVRMISRRERRETKPLFLRLNAFSFACWLHRAEIFAVKRNRRSLRRSLSIVEFAMHLARLLVLVSISIAVFLAAAAGASDHTPPDFDAALALFKARRYPEAR